MDLTRFDLLLNLSFRLIEHSRLFVGERG